MPIGSSLHHLTNLLNQQLLSRGLSTLPPVPHPPAASSQRPAGLSSYKLTPEGDLLVQSGPWGTAEGGIVVPIEAREEFEAALERFGGRAPSRGGLSATHHTLEELDADQTRIRDLAYQATAREFEGVMERGIATGETQKMRNNNGKKIAFQVEELDGSETQDSYLIRLQSGGQVQVNLPFGEDPEVALTRITDLYSQQPENLRGALRTVNIVEGPNPDDAYHNARMGLDQAFVSNASAGGGVMNFYHGGRGIDPADGQEKYLRESLFNHEFGHLVGGAVRMQQLGELDFEVGKAVDALTGDDEGWSVPRGYSGAIREDERRVTNYGDVSLNEDFAEFYTGYRTAVEAGPQALEELKLRYPNRTALLEDEVFSRRLHA